MTAPRAIRSLVGNTPLIQVEGFDIGRSTLFVKLESQNPSGSIKDRMAVTMVEAAEREGRLLPGGTIVEATAGNTGLGLAFVAAFKGYKITLVIPDKMSREKILHLKALGANVILTRSDVAKGHPHYYQDLAETIARSTPGAFYINQFENRANPRAHEEGTGPEIWEQMGNRVDAVVCGVGSGGTLTGLSRFFARTSPETEMVLADPVGSILAHFVETGETLKESGSWLVEGIGEDFIPPIADLSRVRRAYSISDEESFEAARTLLRKNGVLGGSSTGTLLAAAARYAKEQTEPKRIVTFVCDTGNKYLSKMFNDSWMIDQGFRREKRRGDVRDLVARKHAEGGTITVTPDDPLQVAYTRMRTYDVSQLPVLEGNRVVGLVDESDLLHAVVGRADGFKRPIREVMTTDLEFTSPEAPVESLLPIFERGMVALIEEEDRFLGLVTKADLLNHLRTVKDLAVEAGDRSDDL